MQVRKNGKLAVRGDLETAEAAPPLPTAASLAR
jgi:hypothetical protein